MSQITIRGVQWILESVLDVAGQLDLPRACFLWCSVYSSECQKFSCVCLISSLMKRAIFRHKACQEFVQNFLWVIVQALSIIYHSSSWLSWPMGFISLKGKYHISRFCLQVTQVGQHFVTRTKILTLDPFELLFHLLISMILSTSFWGDQTLPQRNCKNGTYSIFHVLYFQKLT